MHLMQDEVKHYKEQVQEYFRANQDLDAEVETLKSRHLAQQTTIGHLQDCNGDLVEKNIVIQNQVKAFEGKHEAFIQDLTKEIHPFFT